MIKTTNLWGFQVNQNRWVIRQLIKEWLPKKIYRFVILIMACFLLSQEGYAGPTSTPLSLPRFASLRSNKVNIHVGPGSDFPVDWMYQRQGLPIEIIAEFDTWRQIRDMEGTTGWVHKSLLMGKRNAVIIQTRHALQRSASADAAVVAYLEPGVIGKLKQCKAGWCRIEVKGYEGWIERKNIWGVYSHEEKI